MYLPCVFRPRTLRREIKLLCMTIMCTWNSSLASVLKKGENRCHRKNSAQFCFLSRWVGVLKYLFWLWSGSVQVSRQTSSPGIGELQRGNRDRDCGVLPGGPGCVAEQVAGVPIEWGRCLCAWAFPSICITLCMSLCCLWNETAEANPSWERGPQQRGWKGSVPGGRAVRVESLLIKCGW